MRLPLFLVLELVLGPLQALALAGYTYKLWRFNIPEGISGTAYEPLFNRVIMHEAGTRRDEAAFRLARHLPALSPAIATGLGSLGIAARLSGYRGALFAFPPTLPSTFSSMVAHRTSFFDRRFAEAVEPGGAREVRQIVVLGAGWDTRSYSLPGAANLRVFEVDTPATQGEKRSAVARAGLPTDRVTFVETDFNQRSWFEAVVDLGLDTTLPTFVLWEGVTMYLDDAAVERTLCQVARLGPGSGIAFDYFSRELVRAEPPFERLGWSVQKGAMFYGEPFTFGVSTRTPARNHVERLVASCGLELAEYEPLGKPDRPHGGLAIAVCPHIGKRDRSPR